MLWCSEFTSDRRHFSFFYYDVMMFFYQAYNLSRDHKPELEAERDRILKAGGFIHAGRVNGSLNLSRAIGAVHFSIVTFSLLADPEKSQDYFVSIH